MNIVKKCFSCDKRCEKDRNGEIGSSSAAVRDCTIWPGVLEKRGGRGVLNVQRCKTRR